MLPLIQHWYRHWYWRRVNLPEPPDTGKEDGGVAVTGVQVEEDEDMVDNGSGDLCMLALESAQPSRALDVLRARLLQEGAMVSRCVLYHVHSKVVTSHSQHFCAAPDSPICCSYYLDFG